MMKSSASVADCRLGAKPPSSPDGGHLPGLGEALLQRLEDLGAGAHRLAQARRAPTGITMNSWMSIGLSACAPPLMMFIIGTGSVRAETPPT